MPALHQNLLAELGLLSLFSSPRDVKLLILQRFSRFFAFGGSTIVLALYLHALELSDAQIGLFMTLALVGDVVSFGLTVCADGVGRRRVLMLGAGLMAASGILLAHSGNFWLLLAAAVVGVLSPKYVVFHKLTMFGLYLGNVVLMLVAYSGREIGPFSAIEESTIAQLTPAPIRSDIFAWYTVIGAAGSSCGKLVTGWAVQHLQTLEGWDPIRSYRAVFLAYAGFGFVNVMLACFLSSKVEAEKHVYLGNDPEEETETEPLLNGNESTAKSESAAVELLPKISKESQAIVFKLCLLFAVDSLASGLVPASWVTYFFHVKFGLPEGELGSLFFTTGLISAASSIIAASLSRRIGLVNTMVFTHLPSAIALSLIPVPASLPWAIFFLVLRSSMASMDIAPKAAFLSAVVLPGERTAVMGFIAVVRTFSQSCGPLITGLLAQAGKFWVTFVVAGLLKAAYDLGLLALFKGHKTSDEGGDGRKKVEDEEEDVDYATGRREIA
jgi:MFS family permease